MSYTTHPKVEVHEEGALPSKRRGTEREEEVEREEREKRKEGEERKKRKEGEEREKEREEERRSKGEEEMGKRGEEPGHQEWSIPGYRARVSTISTRMKTHFVCS